MHDEVAGRGVGPEQGPVLIRDLDRDRGHQPGRTELEAQGPVGAGGQREDPVPARPDPLPQPAALRREPAGAEGELAVRRAHVPTEPSGQSASPRGQVGVERRGEVAEVGVAPRPRGQPAHVRPVDEQVVVLRHRGQLEVALVRHDAQPHTRQVEPEMSGQPVLVEVGVTEQVHLDAVVGQHRGDHARVPLPTALAVPEAVVDSRSHRDTTSQRSSSRRPTSSGPLARRASIVGSRRRKDSSTRSRTTVGRTGGRLRVRAA